MEFAGVNINDPEKLPGSQKLYIEFEMGAHYILVYKEGPLILSIQI